MPSSGLRLAARLRRFMRQTRGSVLIMFALALPVFLGFSALVIDYGMLRLIANRLQITADASALAAASQLPIKADARAEARTISVANYADFNGYPILPDADVVFGNWDGTTFSTGFVLKNAVQVTARRQQDAGTPLAAIMGSVFNNSVYGVARSAVARRDPVPGCTAGGFFTDATITTNSNNTYTSNFCLFGAQGVHINTNNVFPEGSLVVMNSILDFTEGNNNAGIPDVLVEDDFTLELPPLIPAIITDMQSGNIASMPSFIAQGPVNLSKIDRHTVLQPNTLYVVSGDVDFASNVVVENVAIVASGKFDIQSNATVDNVVFASTGKMTFGANMVFGNANHCDTVNYNVYLFTDNDMVFGSNLEMRGAQLGGTGSLTLNSNITALHGISAEFAGPIEYNASDDYGACQGDQVSDFGEIQPPVGLGPFALVH